MAKRYFCINYLYSKRLMLLLEKKFIFCYSNYRIQKKEEKNERKKINNIKKSNN